MSAQDDLTTGTAGGGNAEATGTPVGGNADELAALREKADLAEKLEREKSQWLAEKGNYEALKREKEAAGFGVAQPPAQAPNAQNELQTVYAQLQYLAAGGDPGAKWQLALLEQQQQLARQNQYLQEMMSVPDSNRDEVNRIVRDHNVTPKAAMLMLKGMKASEAEARIAELEERVRKETAQRTVHTATVGVTASEVGKTVYKGSEYADAIARLKRSGDENGVRQLINKRKNGEIQVT